MHQKIQNIIFLKLLSLLLFFSLSVQGTEDFIYINADSKLPPAGTESNPYTDLRTGLLSALDKLGRMPAKSQMTIKIKPSSTPYSIKDPQSTGFDSLGKQFSLKIARWGDPLLNEAGVPNCEDLPTIDGSSFNIRYTNMEWISLYGINLVNLKGSIQVSESKGVNISKSCLNDQDSKAYSFLKIYNTTELVILNTTALVSRGRFLLQFVNDRPDDLASKITITDFVMNISKTIPRIGSNPTYFLFKTASPSDPARDPANGNFRSRPWYQAQYLEAKRLTLNVGERQVLPVIAMVHGFDNVHIHFLSLLNQSFSLTDSGVFQISDITELLVANANIAHNQIHPLTDLKIPADSVFISPKTVLTLNMNDNVFSYNTIYADMKSPTFKLIDVTGIQQFILSNYRVIKNEFYGTTFIIRLNSQPSATPTDLIISDIFLEENEMLENRIFKFMAYSQNSIRMLDLRDVYFLNNYLNGRIFHFETVGFAIEDETNPSSLVINSMPTFLNFTNVLIHNNQNLTNLVFLYFSATNPTSMPANYVFVSEFYSICMENFTVTDNLFYKARSSDYIEQYSLIQSTGSQVLIQNSEIRNNSFFHWNFLSLEQQVNSVFFVNSNVQNNTIESGNFIITRYESVVITKGSFYTNKDQTILALYRFAFILDSKFIDMNLIDSTLFFLNNAYLVFSENKLDTFNLHKSYILQGGNFRPPTIDLADFFFTRNEENEVNVLAANPYLLQTYYNALEKTHDGDPSNVYFYVIEKNEMSNFKITGNTIITFQDYVFQQGIIEIRDNTMKDFYLEGDFTEIINVIELSRSFVFRSNKIIHMKGIGAVLRLNLLEKNNLCIVHDNKISHLRGPSFLLASGGSITLMNISDNVIKSNNFSSSAIVIDLTLNNGDIITSNNTFTNNTVYASDKNLYSKLSFVAITAQAAKGQQTLLFDKWIFKSNSYENMMSFSQYGQLNAFFSLLLANSSVIIRESRFEGITLESKGNSVFYIASKETKIINSTFESMVVDEGLSVFNFLSLEVYLKGNNFRNIDVLNGKGMIYLNTLPFLQKNVYLKMHDNVFDYCVGGSGNILVVQQTNLTLEAMHNGFTDCFDTRAAFLFQSANCDNCSMFNSTFLVRPEGADENLFYQLDSLSGQIKILNTYILYFNDDDEPDIFLTSTNSPNANVTIFNLNWPNISNKNPLQIANVDSGNLTLQNTDLSQFVYSMRKAAGYLIEVSAAPINLPSAAVNLKNVSLSDLKFTRLFSSEKFKAGVIAFLGFGSVKSYYWKLNIEDCKFDSIVNASTLFVQMPAIYNIKIINTTFKNLVNSYAPAINYYPPVSTQSSIFIANCTFENNTAFRGAGAISLNPSNYSLKNNTFTNNKAGDLGGAILLQTTIRTQDFDIDNSFDSNSASMGTDVASILSGMQMELIFPPDTDMFLNTTSRAMTVMNASSNQISKMGLRVSFLDRDGKLTHDIGSSKPNLILTFGKLSTISSFNCTWKQCEIDKFGVVLPGVAGDNINVTVFYYSAPQKNDGQFLLQTFKIKMRDCIPGEYFNKNTKTCDFCQDGSYSLVPSDSCQDCPMHANCTGGNVLIAQAGFFRGSNDSAKLHQCRQDGNQRCEYGKCKVGYTGPLCEACDFKNGYIESGLLKCAQCEDPFVSLGLSILIFVLYLLYKLFCISRLYSTNESFCADRDLGYGAYRSSESGYYVKLLIVYTQVISLVYLSNMEVREFMGSLSQIGNPSTFILVSMQCSLTAMGFAPEQLIYISSAILVLSPFVQCILIFLLAQTVIRKFSRSIHPWHYSRLAVIYIIMVEQPGIVGFLTAFLSCSEVYPDSKQEFIALHPNWVCSDPTYQYFRTLVIFPSLIFWAFIIPVYLFLVLFFKRRRLDTLNVRMSWGALYNINKSEYYYWGTIVMILELIISYTAYAFQADLKARVFTLFIMLWTYQFVVRQYKPYRYAKFNSMESLTFSLLMLNIILGYYAIDNDYDWLKYGSYAALAVLNLSMTLFLAWKLFDITVMRVFDLSLEKFHYLMKGKSQLSPEGRDRMLSVDSYIDDNRSERSDSISSSYEPQRRTSTYAHTKLDESFVL